MTTWLRSFLKHPTMMSRDQNKMTIEIHGWTTIPEEDDPVWDQPGIVFEEEWKKLSAGLEEKAAQISAEEFLQYVEMFPNDSNHMDLDFVFRGLIESKTDYPVAQVFTSTSDNELLSDLRLRCFNGRMVVDHYTIHTFYLIATRIFAAEDFPGNLEDFATYDELEQLNPHETRLLLELLFVTGITTDYIVIRKLLANIDKT